MLLTVSEIRKLFAAEIVLDGASFKLQNKEKVALVGRNGAGKTTLLKLMTGQYEPDSGSIQWARGAKVGYLKQEHAVDESRTVLEEAQAGIAEKVSMQKRLAELEQQMEKGATDDDLEEYARLHEHFFDSSGFDLDKDVRSVLSKMGFDEADFDRPCGSLSGGQKTRLAISRLLLEEPDLLILDEPTNHLDLQATEWLESWIRQYTGAVLLISHDRTFLQNTAQRVMELRNGKIKSYPGDFSQFIKLKAEEEARQAEVAAKQTAEIAKLDEYVRRFMNSQRTAQARGRLKMMEKLIENRVEAPTQDRGLKAGFASAKRSGDQVIVCKGLAVGYGSNSLFSGFDWEVRIGERWGVIGENGAGKSTLIKTLVGRLPSLSGVHRLGSNVSVGYFSQDVSELDEDMTPLEFMVWECGMDAGPARHLLGRFLLSGDDVFRPIRTLSGGEKNKLVLAALTQSNPNLLVLDEPTNHLDMDSREALGGILDEFDGTLVLISHDRWLLSRVTNRILDVRKSGPIQYGGTYAEYRSRSKVDAVAVSKQDSGAKPTATSSMTPREVSKEITRVQRSIENLEDEIAEVERAIQQIEESLSAPPQDADLMALTTKYSDLKSTHEAMMGDWEKESLYLESLRAMQA